MTGSTTHANSATKPLTPTGIEQMLDLIIAIAHRGILLIPHEWRVSLLARVYRLFLWLRPRYRRIAYRNLGVVFPENTEEQNRAILHDSSYSFGRMLSDSLRLKQLDAHWVAAHLHSDRLLEFKETFGGKPVLLLGVHLGSFDLLAWAIPYLRGGPMTFIVRNFKSERLDLWFRSLRESSGNTVIGRERGLRKLVGALRSGSSVGFLFDQNVTRNHAVFLPWFGRVAATTVAPGTLAVMGKCPVVMVAIRHRKGEDYDFVWTEVPTRDLYESNLESAELMKRVTERAIVVAEKDIRAYPHGWFWIHRRWKTTPEGVQENFYQDIGSGL